MVTLYSTKFSEATESREERRDHRSCLLNNDQVREQIVDLSREWRGVVVLPSTIVGLGMERVQQQSSQGPRWMVKKPLSGPDLRMSAASVASREPALQDSVSTMLVCRCANGRWGACGPRLRTWNC